MLGLFTIGAGTGGIKPCVSAFGGEQFKLPEQQEQMTLYFSLFYASINAGGLISSFVTPSLRQNVHCFGEDSCYSLAFAVPAALMVLAVVMIGLGKLCNLYIILTPDENIIVKTASCLYVGTKFQLFYSFTSGVKIFLENQENLGKSRKSWKDKNFLTLQKILVFARNS